MPALRGDAEQQPFLKGVSRVSIQGSRARRASRSGQIEEPCFPVPTVANSISITDPGGTSATLSVKRAGTWGSRAKKLAALALHEACAVHLAAARDRPEGVPEDSARDIEDRAPDQRSFAISAGVMLSP
jgi:hypothetical protein